MKDYNPDLSSQCREIVECDTARISKLGGKLFLVIGFNRNTKDDPGQWCRDAFGKEPVPDWDYVEEKVVASGKTKRELIDSAESYKNLCGMTITEHLMEMINQ